MGKTPFLLSVLALGIAVSEAASAGPESSDGALYYQWYCAQCHGPEANGDGYLAEYLTVAVPDLTALSQNNDGIFPVEKITSYIAGSRDYDDLHGPPEMPVWGPVFLTEGVTAFGSFSDEQLEQQKRYVSDRLKVLVAHLAKIQKIPSQENGEGIDQ